MSNITISFYGDEETKILISCLNSADIRDAIALKPPYPIADKIDQVICKVSEVKAP